MKIRMESEKNAKQDLAEQKWRELTAQEGEVLRSYLSRLDEKTLPTITVSEDGRILSLGHPNKRIGFILLTEQLGTTSADFALDLILQLMCASRVGQHINDRRFNAMLAMVTGSKPRNEFDAALAVHAAITHQAILKIGRQLDAAENVMQQESAQRMYAKLSQAFNSQREALRHGRAGTENIFSVQQNVNVGDGGRAAIVANVNHAARADAQNEPAAATPPALTDATAAPMPIIDDGKKRTVIPERVERYRPKLVK